MTPGMAGSRTTGKKEETPYGISTGPEMALGVKYLCIKSCYKTWLINHGKRNDRIDIVGDFEFARNVLRIRHLQQTQEHFPRETALEFNNRNVNIVFILHLGQIATFSVTLKFTC